MLSAVIITYNEADRIADCIRSANFCDEVLVVDSHSTDGTREIATSLGARVIERDWPGYRSQKEFALRAATNDFVLCLDADERVSPALRAEIEALRVNGFPCHAGWNMPILLCYFGRFLWHGLTYPNRHMRLIDRRRGQWSGEEVHEHLQVNGSIGKLRNCLEHYAYRSLSHQIAKLDRYAELMARAKYARGKRCGVFKILFRSFWRFFSGYILRLGFLDGWRGLVLSLVEADYVRNKYLKLFLLSRGHTI
jgi:glycosyltransferase involved in cell wall biosynthesis